MRTARSSTVLGGAVGGEVGAVQGKVLSITGSDIITSPSSSSPPPPRGQTDAYKNITLPQTSFAGGNNL